MIDTGSEALTSMAARASLGSSTTEAAEDSVTESDTIPRADAGAIASEPVASPGAAFYERVAGAAGAELVDGAARVKAEPAAVGPAALAPHPPPAHLQPALQAAAAAKAAAARIRARQNPREAPDQRRLWLVWSSYTGASLEQVHVLRDRPFRPRRQVVGPLPYSTAGLRSQSSVRAPHLTVPPYMIDRPEIRTDLTAEPLKPSSSERFSRFRAQVERTGEHQLEEDGPAFQAGLPATIALPVQNPPSVWRRLFRLFGVG